MLFDRFDRIRIVSLPNRVDRRREMAWQLRKVGLENDPRVEFFDALRMDDPGPFLKAGSHGCFLSHLQILRESARANKSVLILQDDCDFLPGIAEYELPKCDVFYGGYSLIHPGNPHESDIIGAHFMGFSAEAARKAVQYLQDYLSPTFQPDKRASEQPDFNPRLRPPIDGAFVWFRRAHPELKTEFAMLSRQRSSKSDVSPGWADNVPALRQLLAIGRRLVRT
jgi:glycosyl transferase family 25